VDDSLLARLMEVPELEATFPLRWVTEMMVRVAQSL